MSRLKNWLRQRAQNPRGNLRLLLSGAGLFFCGVGGISMAQYSLPPGLKAELLALAGLILTIAGSILALIGYLSLSVLRIWHILDDDDEQHRDPPP
ncbi:MAG: hypothetical protein AB7S90_06240 [Marinobacterium sp.]|jgi:hypothetical protein